MAPCLGGGELAVVVLGQNRVAAESPHRLVNDGGEVLRLALEPGGEDQVQQIFVIELLVLLDKRDAQVGERRFVPVTRAGAANTLLDGAAGGDLCGLWLGLGLLDDFVRVVVKIGEFFALGFQFRNTLFGVFDFLVEFVDPFVGRFDLQVEFVDAISGRLDHIVQIFQNLFQTHDKQPSTRVLHCFPGGIVCFPLRNNYTPLRSDCKDNREKISDFFLKSTLLILTSS